MAGTEKNKPAPYDAAHPGKQLQTFVQNFPSAVAMFDCEMRYLAVSQRWMDDYYLGSRGIIGCSHYEIFPEISEHWKLIYRRCLAGETMREDEDRIVRADKSVQWLKWEVQPWLAAKGEIGGIIIYSEDITARKLAEQETAKLNEQLEHFFKLTPTVHYACRIDGDRFEPTFISANIKKYFGAEPSEYMGSVSCWLSNLHPEERDGTLKAQLAAIASGCATYEDEFRFRHSNGTYKWIHNSMQIIRNPVGQPVEIVGSWLDITDRKLKEATLLDRQFKLNAIVGYSPSALSLKTPDGRYALANPNLQSIHHLTEDEIIGKTDFDLYPAETAAAFRANDALVLSTKARHSIEEKIPVDGSVRTYMSNMFPVLDDTGTTAFICRISLDITDPKKTEAELVQLKERYQLLFNDSPDAYLIISLDEEIVIDCNKSAEIMLRGTREQILGMSPYELSPKFQPDSRNSHKALTERISLVLEKGQHNFECVHRRLDGEYFWAEVNMSLMHFNEIKVLFNSWRDITERKRNENQLKVWSDFFNKVEFGLAISNQVTNTFIAVNPTFAKQRGYDPDELIGKSEMTIYPPQIHDEIKEKMTVLDSMSNSVFESVHVCKDGRHFPVQLDITTIKSEEGQTLWRIAYALDITERKEAELAYHKLTEDLNATLRSIPDLLFELDGNGTYLKILAQNTELLAAQETILLGSTVNEMLPPEAASKVMEAIREAADTGYSGGQHIRLNLPQGEAWFELSTAFKPGNTPSESTFLVLSRDVTERKRAEQKLLQTSEQLHELMAQYESAREAERKMIASEVHDELGQLLSTLRLEISMVRLRFCKDNSDLMALTHNMIELVDRAIHGVRNVSENLRPAALQMGIVAALEWLGGNFSSQTGIQCYCDLPEINMHLKEERAIVVFRIVQESLTNIIRHSRANSVWIVVSLCGDELCVEVKDNGRGFDINALNQRGTFGLLGMRERVWALGGKLDIVSEVGKGTTVSVRLSIDSHMEEK